jgi:hypothetical protein
MATLTRPASSCEMASHMALVLPDREMDTLRWLLDGAYHLRTGDRDSALQCPGAEKRD